MNPSLIIFDLDGTLAASKAALDSETAALLGDLLIHRRVAVISGASFAQFQHQFLKYMSSFDLTNLSILPTAGSAFYKYDPSDPSAVKKDGWILVYQHVLSADEKNAIKNAFSSVLAGLSFPKIYGEQLEDRDSQFTFSALGQEAPIEAKEKWDPDHKIREGMVEKLRSMLPGFELNIGGMTSIDITKKGIDKEFGINKLVEYFSIPKKDILYVGDAIFPGGNDYAAVTAGLPIHPVKDIAETKEFIRSLLQGILTK